MLTYADTFDPTIPAPNRKAANGHRPGRRPGSGYRQQHDRLAWLIADLEAVRDLERQERDKIRQLRREIYREAELMGLSVEMLRAIAYLPKDWKGRKTRIAAE